MTAVVTGMDTGNVDTVVVNGRILERHGKPLHVECAAIRRLALESRDHVVARSGYRLPTF